MADKKSSNTDQDSLLKAIRKVVREEMSNESRAIRDEFGSELMSARIRIQTDIRENTDRLKNLEIRVNSLQEKTEKNFQVLRKQLKQSFEFLDNDFAPRIKKIEDHLDISSS